MLNLIFCLAVLKNKNSASEFEDLTGFVKGFVNQTTERSFAEQ